MKYQTFLVMGFLLCTFLFTQCTSDSNKDAEKETNEQNEKFREDDNDTKIEINTDGDVDLSGLKKSIDDLEDKLNELNKDGKKEVVDFRKLKDMLPSKIAGMDRVEHKGEKAGAFGFNISTATAEYKDDDQRMEVNIVDVGGIGAAVTSMASWSLLEMDRESEYEYERTTTIDGHKAFEKYNKKSQNGELSMLIDDRFIVNIKGWNVSEKDITKARKAIDVDDLDDLAKKNK